MSYKLHSEIGKNFCYAPWTNIHINTTGTYKTCCAGTEEIGDLRIIPINDLLQNHKLSNIKDSVHNNLEHSNCNICLRQEKHSSVSERTWYNNIAEHEIIEVKDINATNLQNLDIRWSNTCNLSCVYCDHEASSQWAMLKQQPVPRLDYSNTLPSILNLIENNKSTIKNLALLGGEPLLQKENDSLLDVIGDHVNINVITNLSVPLENNKIFNKLLEKHNVMWDISFETVEDRFEYVRRGSSWDLIRKNIKYLIELTKNTKHNIGITSQYSVYNALNLSELHQYFADNNLPSIRWSELHYPEILSVSSLPQSYINKAIEELKLSESYHNSMPVQKQFLQDMANSLKNLKPTKLNCDDLNKWHLDQETKYWPNSPLKFSKLWPEYS
jgi:sulfatase maturation enzyme AslB (radical SAM superfamily)